MGPTLHSVSTLCALPLCLPNRQTVSVSKPYTTLFLHSLRPPPLSSKPSDCHCVKSLHYTLSPLSAPSPSVFQTVRPSVCQNPTLHSVSTLCALPLCLPNRQTVTVSKPYATLCLHSLCPPPLSSKPSDRH